MTEDPRYPIGKYEPRPFSEEQKQIWLNDIKYLPELLEHSILNLDADQLDTPYREGGWTVKQLVHHVADSHMNAYIRFKLVLTEDNPTIKTYDEKKWAELDDVKKLPTNVSLTLLHALHRRWYEAFKNISEVDWQRTAYHPLQEKNISLWFFLGMYAWHGKHHAAHITELREKNKW
ncbi:MAG: putative metal-dependent hydrolase [Bacteroidetes bacterium]|nr:putative metal-dependent hydrolase [Bacteroidota bacterium]